MAELLFILTTVFVAYVVFVVVDADKKSKQDSTPAAKPEASKPVAAVKTEVASKPQSQPAAKKPAPVRKTQPKAASDSLKNPETGEVAKVPNNYRFTKRWIKEALVAEGLLDKIYKNNELDDKVTAKIKKALEQLKSMEKYQ